MSEVMDSLEVLRPGDEGFEALRPMYAMAGEPAVIARPADSQGVVAALRIAREEGLPLSVRSGGHGAAAFPNPDGLVIDLGRLDRIEIDDDGIVRVGPGATWGAVARSLEPHGLALSSGDTTSVGVGGLTLGGGIGWMVRSHGLALDSLLEAQLVTATGELVTASDTENPELFWALRGGGGNFGVVTRFTFRAHPLAGVVAGTIDVALDDLAGLLTSWRDVMRAAPEQLNVTFLAMPAFGDQPAGGQLLVCYGGNDPDAAREAIAPLLAIDAVTGSNIEPKPYADVLDDPQPPEGPMAIVANNGFVPDLSDEAVRALAATHAATPGAVLMIRSLRGAFNRVPVDATAFSHRASEALVISVAFLPADPPAEIVDAVHASWAGFAPHAAGGYGNFEDGTGDEVIARLYPATTAARLAEVKRAWDPANLFSRNHNIRPAADEQWMPAS